MHIVDSLDSVAEAHHALYVKKDGRFHFNVDEFIAFKKLGMAPSEIANLIAEKEAAPELLDKLLAQHEAAAANKIAALEKALADARAFERDTLVEAAIVTAANRAGASSAGIDMMLSWAMSRIAYTVDDGTRRIQILQPDGTPMDGTIEDLVADVKQRAPALFNGG